jgi:hypothetical protein
MKTTHLSLIALLLTTPLLASAQLDPSYLQGYADSIIGIINGILLPVVIAIAFITFIWGVFKYFIQGAASEDSRAEGRQFVLWGIIGFVVIFSLWSIVKLVGGTFGLTNDSAPRPPSVNTKSSPSQQSSPFVPGRNGAI